MGLRLIGVPVKGSIGDIGLGYRVEGSRFRLRGLGFEGLRVSGFGFGASGI